MKTLRVLLRVVFYRDGKEWIAHCLEFDLCGDGKTQDEALSSLTEAIHIQVDESIRHNNAANLFSPADARCFQMFAEGADKAVGQLELKLKTDAIEIQGITAREYLDDQLIPA